MLRMMAVRPSCDNPHAVGLDSGGRGVCLSPFRGVICSARVFRDRPSEKVDLLFYSVPHSNGWLPYATVFRLRFLENVKDWFPDKVGIASFDQRIYKGPIPGPEMGLIVGSPDEWLNGLEWSKYINDEYEQPNGCASLVGFNWATWRARVSWSVGPLPRPVANVGLALAVTTEEPEPPTYEANVGLALAVTTP